MSNENSPRRVYEEYLKGNASLQDVENAAQRVMDRYAEAIKSPQTEGVRPPGS